MRTRLVLPALALLLLVGTPALAAEQHPSAVRYTLPGYLGNSFMNRGVTTCLDLESAQPTLTYGQACVLAAPAAETITIRVSQDPELGASYEWTGLRVDGTPCGLGGWGFAEEQVPWSSECALVAVAPSTNGFTGTIRVS